MQQDNTLNITKDELELKVRRSVADLLQGRGTQRRESLVDNFLKLLFNEKLGSYVGHGKNEGVRIFVDTKLIPISEVEMKSVWNVLERISQDDFYKSLEKEYSAYISPNNNTSVHNRNSSELINRLKNNTACREIFDKIDKNSSIGEVSLPKIKENYFNQIIIFAEMTYFIYNNSRKDEGKSFSNLDDYITQTKSDLIDYEVL